MSGSPEFVAQKTASSPKKPSFTQTCSLLGRYLKEKGSFADITLGMTCSVEAKGAPEIDRPTINLFPMDQMSSRNVGPRSLKSMDLFPQQYGFSLPAPTDDALKSVGFAVNSSNKRAAMESAPMTIFYGGQVVVFNDFPAVKAKEIMLMATKCSTQNKQNPKTTTLFTSNMLGNPNESGIGVPFTAKDVPNLRNNITSHACVQSAQQQPIPGDLPIARRASLHRFLEKRKDRITSKAPYQLSNSTSGSPSEPGSRKSWLALAVEPQQ